MRPERLEYANFMTLNFMELFWLVSFVAETLKILPIF
jgi:hypothetical protein